MNDIDLPTLKQWGMEIGEGIWGTVQGAFNERQTTTQIIVDAAIGMIPLVGDVTAARDLLAVSIHLIREPQRRTQVMEWVLLVILIFALIPVAGGVIKGVGHLAMKVGKDLAENRKILGEVIGFLNRVGHGNAQAWLKALDILKFESELISKFKGFCESISRTITEILKARIGQMLPDKLRSMLVTIGDGMLTLRDLGVSYIPQGLKELNLKLKVLQQLMYEGEVHLLATGEKTLTREVEAHLIEKEVRAAVKAGKWPQNLVKVRQRRKQQALARFFDLSKTKEGWPDLLRKEVNLPGHEIADVYYNSLCTFSGKITAWSAEDFAEKSIYRAFGVDGKLATATNAEGYFWGAGAIPANAEIWRRYSAVLDEWNANGMMVLVTFPSIEVIKQSKELEKALKGWYGRIAEQYGSKYKNQFLEGGGYQVGIGGLPEVLHDEIRRLGEDAKKGMGFASSKMLGVKIEVQSTGWLDAEGKYGYTAAGDDLSLAATTRQLDDAEIKSKLSNSAKLASARASAQLEQR